MPVNLEKNVHTRIKSPKEKFILMNLVDKLSVIKYTVNVISQKIQVLEDKFQNENKESNPASSTIRCYHFNYNASTSTVLKRHKACNHKVKDLWNTLALSFQNRPWMTD